MHEPYNRDNFERLGIDNKNYDLETVMKFALSEHDDEDKEIDTKKTNKKS